MTNMTKLLILTILLVSTVTYAQKESNIWYFGENAGLDFNSGAPVALTNGALITSEGCATISDNMGNLLFYTDGTTVWNRMHMQMPNGFGLMGHSSSTQSALIVQRTGSNNTYYIFTTPAQVMFEGKFGFHCTVVDMTLDGGLGDVTNFKNIQLHNSVTEKLTAVRHANGCDTWVIIHEWNSRNFLAYLVNNAGVNPTPVLSNTGTIHNGGTIAGSLNTNAIGQMKVSPNGSKLALAIYRMNIFELFDFDNATGIVSNPLSFPPIAAGQDGNVYGVEFSPDGSKLYGGLLREIYQYDLLAGTPSDIINSRTLIGSSSATIGALQLAPDGKIYCAHSNDSYLAAVNKPNALGSACNYVDMAVPLAGKMSKFGLPNFMQSHFYNQFSYVNTCIGDSTFFSGIDIINVDSVFWNFDDPASGAFNTSVDLTPYHIFSAPGMYNVEFTKYMQCGTFVFARTVTIDSLPVFSLGNDTILCPGTLLTLNVETQGANYLWQDNSSSSNLIISSPDLYWVEVMNSCGSVKDSIEVGYFPDLNVDLGKDTVLCSEQSLILDVSVPGATYIWQNNSTAPAYTINTEGLYWVEVTDTNNCSQADSITIGYSVPPNVNLGKDTILCQGQSLELDATSLGVNYLWQDGSLNALYPVSSTGLYWVEVTDSANCSGSDTISVKVQNVRADFEYEEIPCTNQIQFVNLSSEMALSYWNFGNGATSIENNPLHAYQANEKYRVVLVVTNPNSACADTAEAIIPFENDAFTDTLFVPNVFTPNGDGKNDYFEIKGFQNPCTPISSLTILNRWGKVVFKTEGTQFKWDGKSNDTNLIDGVYFYVIEGEYFQKSGSVTLLR